MQQFYDGSNTIICGPSSSGKTTLLKRIIDNSNVLYETKPHHVIFIFKHWQPLYQVIESENNNVTFINHIPEECELLDMVKGSSHSMLICDDMLSELNANSFALSLFTRLSHHYKISTIIMQQSNTMANKFNSSINKNSHYTILMRSSRDGNTLRSMGGQLNDYKKLLAAYKDATSQKPFSYILIDSHPKSNPKICYKTSIFPDDEVCIAYV